MSDQPRPDPPRADQRGPGPQPLDLQRPDPAFDDRPPPDVRRPRPARRASQRARDWIEWFGVARLLAAAVAAVAVAAAAVWLLRAPPPATEALLPAASTTAAVPATAPVATADVAADGAAAASSASEPAPTTWLVHVAGAVASPGVHELPAGARVVDAIASAGGAAPGADLDALNLAAPTADGARVYVPIEGEQVPAVPAAPGAAPGSVPGAGTRLDLNVAGVAELDGLPGIGPATASAIVEHRERNGPFASVDDLEAVTGIGPAKLAAIRDLVAV